MGRVPPGWYVPDFSGKPLVVDASCYQADLWRSKRRLELTLSVGAALDPAPAGLTAARTLRGGEVEFDRTGRVFQSSRQYKRTATKCRVLCCVARMRVIASPAL